MHSIICTLFEGHYHYGLAALANSLSAQGFKGSIYAGYRGTLPPWAKPLIENNLPEWREASSLKVTDDIQIHFLPIQSEFHLTNYKPYFMMDIWKKYGQQADAIVYFDPDIVIKCAWSFFERWVSVGVALVHEIVSNDMPPTHPIRLEWHKVIEKAGKKVSRNLHSYINGGFCGVSKDNIQFIQDWCDITTTAIQHFGMTPNQWDHSYTRTFIFYAQDQDALNITAMCSEQAISEIGPEGMDFIHGGFTMSHALGSPKPWKKNYIQSAFKGITPSLADKCFWQNVSGPLVFFDASHIKQKRVGISLASLIGRFYRRG